MANPANLGGIKRYFIHFSQISGIGTPLELYLAPARTLKKRIGKGRFGMSAQSHFTRTLVAFAAALFVSSVAVGAAVGPAQVAASASVSARA